MELRGFGYQHRARSCAPCDDPEDLLRKMDFVPAHERGRTGTRSSPIREALYADHGPSTCSTPGVANVDRANAGRRTIRPVVNRASRQFACFDRRDRADLSVTRPGLPQVPRRRELGSITRLIVPAALSLGACDGDALRWIRVDLIRRSFGVGAATELDTETHCGASSWSWRSEVVARHPPEHGHLWRSTGRWVDLERMAP